MHQVRTDVQERGQTEAPRNQRVFGSSVAQARVLVMWQTFHVQAQLGQARAEPGLRPEDYPRRFC